MSRKMVRESKLLINVESISEICNNLFNNYNNKELDNKIKKK